MTTRADTKVQVPRDPGRRDRLIDVALGVVAARGVAGATHRAVAEAAGVPLGSTTYYFETLEDLHAEAMERHAANILGTFRRRIEPITDRDELLDALVDLVVDYMTTDDASTVVTIELYALATRKPRFKAIADGWILAHQQLYATHMDMTSAKAVDALLEGITIHQALSRVRLSKADLRDRLASLILT
jgi:TetR/AcrR family transcriptional regulator, regulator of biofilm formation and stress response